MHFVNPFSESDLDRHQIWEIIVRHDFEAFVAGDWSMIEDDFWEEGFSGVDARHSAEPLDWRLTYPDLASYRDEWLRQVETFAPAQLKGTTVLKFLLDSCVVDGVEINEDRAIVRKKFDNQAITTDGREISLRFQTLYQLFRRNGNWKIEGFVGYLPNPMPRDHDVRANITPW